MKHKKNKLFMKYPLIIFPALYIIAIAVWVFFSSGVFLRDVYLQKKGLVKQGSLDLADATYIVGMIENPDENYQVTYSNDDNGNPTIDPQIEFTTQNGIVRTMRVQIDYSNYGGELALYYARSTADPYDANNAVAPTIEPDGPYLFVLPRERIEKVRIDPASRIVNVSFGSLYVNDSIKASQFFIPDWKTVSLLLFVPTYSAALLLWINQLLSKKLALMETD